MRWYEKLLVVFWNRIFYIYIFFLFACRSTFSIHASYFTESRLPFFLGFVVLTFLLALTSCSCSGCALRSGAAAAFFAAKSFFRFSSSFFVLSWTAQPRSSSETPAVGIASCKCRGRSISSSKSSFPALASFLLLLSGFVSGEIGIRLAIDLHGAFDLVISEVL